MIRTWAGQQVPPAPPAFLPHLDATDPATVDGLLTAARRGLEASLGEGAERQQAFALLGADAYLTWACVLTMEQGGGASELATLVRRLVEGLA